MKEHDPKVLADVKEYGRHVVKILDQDELPGWAFSIGLHKNFAHPEIIVFGLDLDVAHYLINAVGDEVKAGKKFEIDGQYYDLIDTYACTFSTTCGSGWVLRRLRAKAAQAPTRYRRWY